MLRALVCRFLPVLLCAGAQLMRVPAAVFLPVRGIASCLVVKARAEEMLWWRVVIRVDSMGEKALYVASE